MNEEYIYYLGRMITSDARYTCEITRRITMAKAAFSYRVSFYQKNGLKFEEETDKMLHLEHSFVWC